MAVRLSFVSALLSGWGIWAAQGDALEFTGSLTESCATPKLPYYMRGQHEKLVPRCHEGTPTAPHSAEGDGLSFAEVGHSTSFTITLAGENGDNVAIPGPWNLENGRFIFVSISGENQVVHAEVVNNLDGTLTATYRVDFPGTYLIHVVDVNLFSDIPGKTRPIKENPFYLKATGESVFRPDDMAMCGTSNEPEPSGFWKSGSWISSSVASAKHGVLRNGWVFQPEHCVYDAFTYDEIMSLAALEEPTWLLVLGGSVQRGIFLSLVDLVLAQGQKDEMAASIIEKCWGWSDIHVGNLRITYQDMRLWIIPTSEDLIVCNDEKLASGDTSSYLHAADNMLRNVIFAEGSKWPDVIAAPSFLSDNKGAPNFAVKLPADPGVTYYSNWMRSNVSFLYDYSASEYSERHARFQVTGPDDRVNELVMNALPPEWDGKLIMLEHMSAFGFHWRMPNPTMRNLYDARLSLTSAKNFDINFSPEGIIKLVEEFEQRDPRVAFLSTFPVSQPILWENERDIKDEGICYGCSQHFHFAVNPEDARSYTGSHIIHSMVTEMLANIMIGAAVGTKGALNEKADATPDIGIRIARVRGTPFQVCTDCPANLVPFHVKFPPSPTCADVTSLEADDQEHSVWDNERCPDWCMATKPVSQTPTQSGFVNVRQCKPDFHRL